MLLLVGQVSACSDGGDSGPVGLDGGDLGELEVRALAGSDQEAPVGSILGEPLVLQVVRADGTPVPGVEVEWTFQNGRGATNTDVALSGRTTKVLESTDENGRSEVWWELGTTPGEQEARGGLVGDDAAVGVQGGPQAASGWQRWRRWKARATVGVPAVVVITPESALLEVGDTLALKATVKDAYGNLVTGETVSWKSYDTAVATVGPSGTVEADGEGEAIIAASAGTALGKAWVTVVDPQPTDSVGTDLPVSRVLAEPDTVRFSFVGETHDLSVTAEDGTGAEVAGVTFGFESSNSSIVQVGSMGRLTARAVGMATIAVSALCCDVSDSVVVIVDDVPQEISISVVGSTVTTDTLELEVGQTAELSAAARNEVGSVVGDVEISWSSSNSGIASVTNAGVVTAVAPGQANIRASASGLTAVMPTVVTEVPTEPDPEPTLGSLTLSPASATITGVGATRQFSLTARDSGGNVMSASGVTWQSSNPSVASVNNSGLVTAQGIGTALIVVAAACCSSDTSQVVVIEESTTPGETVFDSDWSSGTGNGNTALTDGGLWDSFVCGQYASYLSVIPATSGFPAGMENVLRVGAGGSTGCGMLKSTNGVSAPAVGESRFYRVYLKYVSTSNNLSNQHFLQPNSENLPHAWNWRWQRPSNGRVALEWILVNQVQGWPNTAAVFSITLNVGTVYRLEYELRRTGSGTAQMTPRIYLGDSDTVLYDGSDFRDIGGAVNQTMEQANPTIRLESLEDLYTFELGQNGPAGASTVTNDFFQAGGFAVSSGGWVGPR
jgi:uncharacterized protein YjdB